MHKIESYGTPPAEGVLVERARPGNALLEVPRWAIFERRFETAAGSVRRTLVGQFTAPSGRESVFWGFHRDACATEWAIRFTPDQLGRWRWTARFEQGELLGQGEFECVDSTIPGPLTAWSENPVWFAAGSARPVLLRGFHVGDRFGAHEFSPTARARFLDWIEERGYNLLSIASHYLNRGSRGRGLGWRTPQLWDPSEATVRPAEYDFAENLLGEMARRRIYVFPFAGFFGRRSGFPTVFEDQEFYIRYTVARFSPFWNTLLNVAGPEPLWKPEDYGSPLNYTAINLLGETIGRFNVLGRLLTVHNRSGDDAFAFAPWQSFTTLQGGPAEKATEWEALHHFCYRNHTGARPIYAHEVLWPGNIYHADLDPEAVRRKALALLFGGVGAINFGDMDGDSSSGFSGSLDPADARLERHEAFARACAFFEEHVPFARLRPSWDAVAGGIALANENREFWVYVPDYRADGMVKIRTGRDSQRWQVRWCEPGLARPIWSRTQTCGQTIALGGGGGDRLVHIAAVESAA